MTTTTTSTSASSIEVAAYSLPHLDAAVITDNCKAPIKELRKARKQHAGDVPLDVLPRYLPPSETSVIANACNTAIGVELTRSKPGPKPAGIRLIVRTPRGPNGKPMYYVKRPGQQAVSTGLRVQDVKEVEKLVQLLTMQDMAVRMGHINPNTVPIDVVISFWIGASRPVAGASHREWKRYRDSIAKWKMLRYFLKGKTFGDLDQEMCRKYIAWRLGETDVVPGLDGPRPCPKVCGSLSTVHGDLKLLDQAIQMFKVKHRLASAPTVFVPPKSGKRIVWLTPDEVKRIAYAILGYIWDHGTNWWATVQVVDEETGETKVRLVRRAGRERAVRRILFRFLMIGVMTGTRHTALINLRWTPDADHGYFDLENGIIHRAGHAANPQDGKPRMSSYVPGKLLRWLRCWSAADRARGIDHVIHKLDGTGYRSSVGDLWNAVVADAGLGADVVPHVMRHTCATWLKLKRIPVQLAADFIGMHPKTLTTVYGQWSIEGSKWTAQQFDDLDDVGSIGAKMRETGKTSSVAAPREQPPRRKLRRMSQETRNRLSAAMAGVWRRRKTAR